MLTDLSMMALFAQDAAPAESVQQVSYLFWLFQSLGFYSLLLLGSGFMMFVGAVLVAAMSRRPSVLAAYLALVPIPAILGVIGMFHGLITIFEVVATAESAVHPASLASGISSTLVCPLTGILCSLPAFLVTVICLLVKVMLERSPEAPVEPY